MDLKGKKIGIAVTGSFCTIDQAVYQAEILCEMGAELYPIFSENVQNMDTKFGKKGQWEEEFTRICKRKVIKTIPEAEPIGPKSYLDCLIILPCTGNTLSKLVHGITDTTVLMAAKAHLRSDKPVVLAVCTNDGLSKNAQNIGAALGDHNLYLVPFAQDDPIKKPFSVVANIDLVPETIMAALEHKQIQPKIGRAHV